MRRRSSKRRLRRTLLASVVATTACFAAMTGPVAATGADGGGGGGGDGGVTLVPVATGLNGSWGIDTGPWPGSVLVAESGTGDVLKVWDGGQFVLGSPGVGVVDVGLDWSGASYVIGQSEAGTSNVIGRVSFDGAVTIDADLGAFEVANNPDQGNTYGVVDVPPDCDVPPELQAYSGIVDSNAYGLEVLPDGKRLVADAAGNDVLLVDHNGDITLVAVLPPVPKSLPAELPLPDGAGTVPLPPCLHGATYLAEPVPTAVVVGPDGWLYVTGLTGVPELPGTGVVFRVNPWTGESSIWQSGLTTAGDLAFDVHGRLYVAEIFGGTGPESDTPGALTRIDTKWGAQGLEPIGVETVATGLDGLITPLGVTVDLHGDVYVSVKSLPLGPPVSDEPPPATGEIVVLRGL